MKIDEFYFWRAQTFFSSWWYQRAPNIDSTHSFQSRMRCYRSLFGNQPLLIFHSVWFELEKKKLLTNQKKVQQLFNFFFFFFDQQHRERKSRCINASGARKTGVWTNWGITLPAPCRTNDRRLLERKVDLFSFIPSLSKHLAWCLVAYMMCRTCKALVTSASSVTVRRASEPNFLCCAPSFSIRPFNADPWMRKDYSLLPIYHPSSQLPANGFTIIYTDQPSSWVYNSNLPIQNNAFFFTKQKN